MRAAPPAAQRALIARATDPSTVERGLVERIASPPEIVADVERDVLGLRSSNNPKARFCPSGTRWRAAWKYPTRNCATVWHFGPGALRAALGRIATFRRIGSRHSRRTSPGSPTKPERPTSGNVAEASPDGRTRHRRRPHRPPSGGRGFLAFRPRIRRVGRHGGGSRLTAVASGADRVLPLGDVGVRAVRRHSPRGRDLARHRCAARRTLLTSLLSNVASSRNQSRVR